MKTKTKARIVAKTKAKPAAKKAKAKPRPARMQPLSPHLVCAGAAKAIDFYKKAFGATEMMRLPGKDGKLIHASVEINGAMVMLVDEFPQMHALSPTSLKGTPVTIHLMVDDVDAFTKRAVKAGAKVVMPVADMFWGDRYGIIEDPFGHRWSIATHLRDMSAKEIQAAMRSAMPQ
jgi:PhnB protein